MDYGLQLYSIRDITQKDMRAALNKVAGLGYKMIEFAGFFGIPANEIADMLKENGLSAVGTHTALTEFKQDYDKALAYHRAIGNTHVYIPWADMSTRESMDAFIADVNEYLPRLQKDGITLGYHNHDFEYRVADYGVKPINELISRTNLQFEVDIYWVFNAGADPLWEMRVLGSRLECIHLKDGFPGGEGVPLGQGEAPVVDALRLAMQLGVPVIVESETLNPDGITEARTCMEYLKGLSA